MLSTLITQNKKRTSTRVTVYEDVYLIDIADPKKQKETNFDKIKESFLYALKNSFQNNRSFAAQLLNRFKLEVGTLKDARLVFANQSSCFNVHNDLGHQHSSNTSITIHLNLFRSENYIPGDNASGPWVIEEKKEYDNSAFISSDGFVKGYLGERYVWFDKSNKIFIDSRNRRAVEHSKGKSTNFTRLPENAVMKVILRNNGEKENRAVICNNCF